MPRPPAAAPSPSTSSGSTGEAAARGEAGCCQPAADRQLHARMTTSGRCAVVNPIQAPPPPSTSLQPQPGQSPAALPVGCPLDAGALPPLRAGRMNPISWAVRALVSNELNSYSWQSQPSPDPGVPRAWVWVCWGPAYPPGVLLGAPTLPDLSPSAFLPSCAPPYQPLQHPHPHPPTHPPTPLLPCSGHLLRRPV